MFLFRRCFDLVIIILLICFIFFGCDLDSNFIEQEDLVQTELKPSSLEKSETDIMAFNEEEIVMKFNSPIKDFKVLEGDFEFEYKIDEKKVKLFDFDLAAAKNYQLRYYVTSDRGDMLSNNLSFKAVDTAFLANKDIVNNWWEYWEPGINEPEDKIVGYFPYWAPNTSEIDYAKLTHINYAFLIPRSNGNFLPLYNSSRLEKIVAEAKKHDVKVLISVGGWSYQGELLRGVFEELARDESTRENFINNLIEIVDKYNLDGVDIDWEYPEPVYYENSSAAKFATLISELRQELAEDKLLTAAVTSGIGGYGSGIKDEIFTEVDFLNIMAYDGGPGKRHSPYSLAEDSLDYWVNQRGLDKNKAVLGVPFYTRPSLRPYRNVVAENYKAAYLDNYQGYNYNGKETIRKKSRLAKNQGGGIMIWELSQDSRDDNTSLLTAIYETLQGEDSFLARDKQNLENEINKREDRNLDLNQNREVGNNIEDELELGF